MYFSVVYIFNNQIVLFLQFKKIWKIHKVFAFTGHGEQCVSSGDSLGCSARTFMWQSNSTCPSVHPDRTGSSLTYLAAILFQQVHGWGEVPLGVLSMGISVCWSRRNKVPQTWLGGAWTREMDWLTDLESRSLTPRWQHGWFSLRAVRRGGSVPGLSPGHAAGCLPPVSPLLTETTIVLS